MTNTKPAEKYNVPAPRYTSYPTVPYWETSAFNVPGWKNAVTRTFEMTNQADGISLYIHLPFCEDLCTYCGCNTRITKNHHVEIPYINGLLQEWKMYRELMDEAPIIREIHLGGGTPTFFSAKNLQLMITGILTDTILHPDAEFGFEAHPANTTVGHLQTLYALGFKRLSLGIQDFDPKVQFIINRRQSFEQVQAITKQARHIGYASINYDLIYGLPLQTLDGLAKTLDMVAELRPERIAFYSYAHIPWIKPGQRRFTEDDLPDAASKLALYEKGRTLLRSNGYKEIGLDHFALPDDTLFHAEREGRLHRNFMGYTHHNTELLIGLGVSSISDAGIAFSQNVKTVEDYLQIVNEGRLPVLKGHLLTGEDMVIRRHILNIMCKGGTTWDEPVEAFILTAIERLRPLVADGFIKLHYSGLEVMPRGRRFLRNICMALDARLWEAQPEGRLFSMSL